MEVPSKILTLTTDWHNDDFYTGMLTGRILSALPDFKVANISHSIATHNIAHAAFVIRYCFNNFPKGSIHLCMVNSDGSNVKQIIAFEYEQHYFIAPDNGIISLITNELPKFVYVFSMSSSGSFSSLNAVINAIISINNATLTEAPLATNFELKRRIEPTWDTSTIMGNVIHIDSYNNAITNISRELFERVRKERQYEIFIQSNSNKVDSLNKSYSEASSGSLIAIFNSIDLLEIALIDGNLAQLYSLSTSSSIIINFNDNNFSFFQ